MHTTSQGVNKYCVLIVWRQAGEFWDIEVQHWSSVYTVNSDHQSGGHWCGTGLSVNSAGINASQWTLPGVLWPQDITVQRPDWVDRLELLKGLLRSMVSLSYV